MEIKLTLNGERIVQDIEPDLLLIDFVRKNGCYSVKRGCDTSNCGLCTVLLNDKPVLSCSVLAMRANGAKVVTLEGMQEEAKPLATFIASQGAEQCGFCNPGFMMNTLDLLKEKTYLDSLQLDDYFILGLELYLEEHNYDDLKVYHFNELIQEIKNDLKPDLREIERLDLKNIAQSFRELTNHQIFKNYLSYFISKKEENLNYENLFLKEFVLAMFISCILSYDLS